VYSCYRDEEIAEEKITNSNINTSFIRLLINDKRKRDILGFWHQDSLVLNIFEGIECDNQPPQGKPCGMLFCKVRILCVGLIPAITEYLNLY
jgi:hypothetical protein